MASKPEEETDGATPQELLIEAARRNNTDLLLEVINSAGSPEKAALLLNNTKTVLGNYIYHEAALRGNYEIIDMLLDQEGFECDPISTREGDTPLHSAVRYINTLPPSDEVSAWSADFLGMMTEAGSDPRVRNKANLTPAALVDPRNEPVKRLLQDAVDIQQNAGDFVPEIRPDDDDEALGDDYAGSASDSDFDPEEYRREREKRKAAAGGEGMI